VTLRLVQPSVEQSTKWEASLRTRHVQQLIDLTQGPGYEGVTHIVWPETAVPYDLSQDLGLRSVLAQLVPRGGLLIAGAPRFAQGEGAWNSLYAIDSAGAVVAVYDKAHLVPFGEYVPFREILGALAIPVTQGSFEAGPGLVSLALPGLPAAAPLICYEIIFSGEVIARSGERPGFLLNLTNDAWFGRSSGPFQHFAQARLRAVEEGLPLVRAANNGVSAIVDAYGRVLGELPLDAVGVLDGNLPNSLETNTVYAVMGDLILVPLSVVPAILGVLLVRRNRQDRRMSDNR
jgi:apolipoprotein N-acyltransferase